MTHLVVDPLTRIEGHLRIEAEVENGRVQDAWSPPQVGVATVV